MKWNKYQPLVYLCYFFALSCFCLASFFPLLVQSLSDNSKLMEKSQVSQRGADSMTLSQIKKKNDSPKPKKWTPANKNIDKTDNYDIAID